MEYYKKKCETDPEYRAKMNERKKAEYRVRTIRECDSDVLYLTGRPGRPRKYGIGPTREHYIRSTPSTATPEHSTNGSGDETG